MSPKFGGDPFCFFEVTATSGFCWFSPFSLPVHILLLFLLFIFNGCLWRQIIGEWTRLIFANFF